MVVEKHARFAQLRLSSEWLRLAGREPTDLQLH